MGVCDFTDVYNHSASAVVGNLSYFDAIMNVANFTGVTGVAASVLTN